MRSPSGVLFAVAVALAISLAAAPPVFERLAPQAGLTRSYFALPGFGGPAVEARTTDIDLRFLDEQPELPRQQISARWRGYFFVARPQTVEFFAGGNDEVELRVDGALLIRRNLREGMRTQGHRVALDTGAHELAVDFQQFGGGMALNIQRALEGQPPGPFLTTELFAERPRVVQVWLLETGRWLRRTRARLWAGLLVLLLVIETVRTFAAPRSVAEYAKRVAVVAAPAALAPTMVFLIGPHTIFTSNAGEFAVPLRDLAFPGLVSTAVLWWLVLLAGGCCVSLLSERLTRMYAATLLALGVMLWGQGNIWNPDYGVLAGREIEFAEHAWRSPYEIAAVGAVLGLAAVFAAPISRIATFASLVFIGIQGGAAAATTIMSAAPTAQWTEPPAAAYQFSSTQNIIHIVLDEFQSDLFTDILGQERATLDKQFSGFEYFADHAGSFPTTSLSLPAMLTGREYRNEKPVPEFMRAAFLQDSIFAKVSRAGYDVDAISIMPPASLEYWLGAETTPNWKGARFRIRKPFLDREDYRKVSARQLLELSVFRHVPHAAKVWMDRNPKAFSWLFLVPGQESPAEIRLHDLHEASSSIAFFEHFMGSMRLAGRPPLYKLIHLGVPHRPIVADKECRFIGVTPITRLNYGDQCRCAIKLVGAFLDRLRALNVYDNSLIVVSSDHGTDLAPWGLNGTSETLSLIRGPAIPRMGIIAGTTKALMLIKPPRRSGPVTISEAPTSHIDLPSTILDLMGLPDDTSAVSMFKREPKEPRVRSFGMYEFRQRFPSEYLEQIHILSIERRVVDAAGWNFRNTVWPPAHRLEAHDIDFLAPESSWYLGPGWSMERQESTGSGRVTFVEALTREDVLFVPSNARELVLHARSLRNGFVRVAVDGRAIDRLEVSAGDYRDYMVRIPESSVRTPIRTVTLTFDSVDEQGAGFRIDRLGIR